MVFAKLNYWVGLLNDEVDSTLSEGSCHDVPSLCIGKSSEGIPPAHEPVAKHTVDLDALT